MAKHPRRLAGLPDVVTGSLSGPVEFLHLRDTFSVTTRICSTKLTQDGMLLRAGGLRERRVKSMTPSKA